MVKCKKVTTEIFIERSLARHGNAYDYSKTIYRHPKVKVIITCPIHGDFLQRPYCHLKGSGCNLCALDRVTNSLDKFISLARAVHGDKYNYSKVNYINNNSKVIIICPKHGEFEQRPRIHTSGTGCSKCRVSKGELAIQTYLSSNSIAYVHQKYFDNCRNPATNRVLYFDFYLPNDNLIIEFDGEQHYRPKSWGKDQSQKAKYKKLEYTQRMDNIKNTYAYENNINLIRIPYTKINHINSILNDALYKAEDTIVY